MRHEDQAKAGADMQISAARRARPCRNWARALRLVKTALGLGLCFTLGAAFSHAAWAQGGTPGGIGGQAGEVLADTEPDLKKIWLPDFLIYENLWRLHEAIIDDFSLLLTKYDQADTSLRTAFARYAGVGSDTRLLRLAGAFDGYLLGHVAPERRPLAWGAASGLLQRLLLDQTACLRENISILEGLVRQRRAFPPQAASGYAPAGEMQRLMAHCRELEACYVAAADRLKAEKRETLAMLSQEVRQVLRGPARMPDDSGLLAKARQARPDIAARTEALAARGAAEGGRNSLAPDMLLVYVNIDDALRTAEICAEDGLKQLAINKNLPRADRRIADAAVKNITTVYFDYILESFDLKLGSLARVDGEFRGRGEDGGYYILTELAIYRQSHALVRELREFILAYE